MTQKRLVKLLTQILGAPLFGYVKMGTEEPWPSELRAFHDNYGSRIGAPP
jgi:hypothetical protein